MLNVLFASSFAMPDLPAGSEPLPLLLPPPDAAELPGVECSSDDVLHQLATIHHTTASGPDGLSSTMLCSTCLSTAETLTTIFNQSLREGVVPADWKQSNAIMDHVLQHNYLSKAQFGFRPGASMQEAVLSATRRWHLNMEEGGSTAVAFFDMSKAFDSLPHSLILSSLARVGVCGSLLAWIQSYLSGRSQCVVLNGCSSSPAPVTSGVPQGSILRPFCSYSPSLPWAR